LKFLNKLTDCNAIGIRLKNGDDYPYYVYDGFAKEFIEKEKYLCCKDENGNFIKEPDSDNKHLECMCGNIIRGRFNPDLPFFTNGGSFWSNHTTKLLTETSDEDRQAKTRNLCNRCGYESVALIPIKVNKETIGLIQLNDKSKNKFELGLIEFVEMLGEQIGIAIENNLSFLKLEEMKTKLATSNKELDQFAYSASHDLQAPLRKINTFSTLLENELKGNLNADCKIYLDAIKRSSVKMTDFISKLLEYSRISNKKIKLKKIQLNQLVNSIIDEFVIEIKETNAKVDVDALPEITGTVVTLQQLFQNLISNALKYKSDEKAPHISIYALNDTDTECDIVVEDNGIGITENNYDTVFQPFKRLHSSDKYKGSGIGLATCKKIVEKYNGSIKIEKNPSGGTRFIVNLAKRKIDEP
jgi:signal transduction histidine kinase